MLALLQPMQPRLGQIAQIAAVGIQRFHNAFDELLRRVGSRVAFEMVENQPLFVTDGWRQVSVMRQDLLANPPA
jgi:hypothetical protein